MISPGFPWSYIYCNFTLGNSQGAKKIIFTACHSDKLKLAFTSPDVISTSPKTSWLAELISQFFCHLNSSKNITCLSGKLKTEFTSPIAKFTSPRLQDTTFFACWTRTLHKSNLPLTWSNFCFPSDHFYKTLPLITWTMFWALNKSGRKNSLLASKTLNFEFCMDLL